LDLQKAQMAHRSAGGDLTVPLDSCFVLWSVTGNSGWRMPRNGKKIHFGNTKTMQVRGGSGVIAWGGRE